MKKKDVAGLIVYALMVVIAVLVALLIIRPLFESGVFPNAHTIMLYVYTFLIIIGALIINAVGLEVVHLLGALVGKYEVVEFNVFGLSIRKTLGKWKFGFHTFDGLTGSTVVAPKSEKSSLKAYVWFPIIIYLIELITGVVLYSIFAQTDRSIEGAYAHHLIALISIIFVTVSSMLALYNFVPFELDSETDGHRLVLITKKINQEAFNELMRIENLQREGKEIDSIRVFDEITEFTANINLISVYEHLAKGEFKDAEKLIDAIIVDPEKISRNTYYRLLAQKLYIKIMTLPRSEAEKYYDDEIDDKVRRFISNDASMESVRAYILIAGMLDDSQAEVYYAISCVKKAMKHALPSRAKIEEKLYKDALEIVKKSHSHWEWEEAAK